MAFTSLRDELCIVLIDVLMLERSSLVVIFMATFSIGIFDVGQKFLSSTWSLMPISISALLVPILTSC